MKEYSDIFLFVYILIPLLSLLFGFLQSLQEVKEKEGLSVGEAMSFKAVGLLMLPPIFIQMLPFLLLLISNNRILIYLTYIIAGLLFIAFIPLNYRVGYYSIKRNKPTYIEVYQNITLFLFLILMAIVLILAFVIK